MSVAAIDSNKQIASFSQQNAQVEIAAPGVGVLSTVFARQTIAKVDGVNYPASFMEYAGTNTATGNLVDCGLAESNCPAAGSVCLIARGNISFADKVTNCQAGGGVAAIIYNNE